MKKLVLLTAGMIELSHVARKLGVNYIEDLKNWTIPQIKEFS